MNVLECVICKCEIEPRELVVCTNCHSAYHRECLKLAFSDKRSHLYHCCSYCTVRLSFMTLIHAGEVSVEEIEERVINERASSALNAIGMMRKLICEIDNSYVRYEHTYAFMTWYMTMKQLKNPVECQGMETFIDIVIDPVNNENILKLIDAINDGMYFVHSNFVISKSQISSLLIALASTQISKLTDDEFFDIYDLVSDTPSKHTFKNLDAPKVESNMRLGAFRTQTEHPRYQRYRALLKKMSLNRLKPKIRPLQICETSYNNVVQLCSKISCDGYVIGGKENECVRCHLIHCKRCGRAAHKGLCDAVDVVENSNRLELQHICFNCHAYINITPKNNKNNWYCTICKKAFRVDGYKLYETEPTYEQLIETIVHNDVTPLLDSFFTFSHRVQLQLLQYLRRTCLEPQLNTFYLFIQILIQLNAKYTDELIIDTLITATESARFGTKVLWPANKSQEFLKHEFILIVKEDVISLLKLLSTEPSFDKVSAQMSSIIEAYKVLIQDPTDCFKQFKALIKSDDARMLRWSKENLS